MNRAYIVIWLVVNVAVVYLSGFHTIRLNDVEQSILGCSVVLSVFCLAVLMIRSLGKTK